MEIAFGLTAELEANRSMLEYEDLFENHMKSVCDENPDPSHDIYHVKRVVKLAKALGTKEGADLEVVIPAAYLHDCVYISKTDSRRKQSSKISADRALELLGEWNYPAKFFPKIHHAILTHSFSANVPAETLEAKVVQDADRLDAMGAIGIFRCFAFSGVANRPLYDSADPFCEDRELNDQTNTLDHFYTKLLLLKDRLNTESAKVEAEVRMKTMQSYLAALRAEI